MLTCTVGRLQLRVDPARPIYVQIVEQIQRGALRGLLDPGERLPSVRQLSLALGVNPNTVARAYRELEAAGAIETRSGSGTFVAADTAGAQARQMELAREATVAWAKEMRDLGVPADVALAMARDSLAQPATAEPAGGSVASERDLGREAPRKGVQP